jgi:hypothetical protein
MKNLFTFMMLLIGGMLMAQSNQITFAKTENAKAIITWEKTKHDFGKIPQGKPVTITYEFTNSGTGPLIIASVNPSCGCTTNDFTKSSIAPGKKGFITLTYNAAAIGNFTKSATVNTNADPGQIILYFNGEVMAETASN